MVQNGRRRRDDVSVFEEPQIRDITASFVDDIAVHSDEFDQHLKDFEKFLMVIKESGFTLNLKKNVDLHRVK